MIRTGTFVSMHAFPVNQTVTSPSLSVNDNEHSEARQPPSRFSARRPRLALSAQAHQVCTEKTRRWHSMLAGVLSGGLVLFAKRLRRVAIANKSLFGTFLHSHDEAMLCLQTFIWRPSRFTQRLYLKTWFPPTQWRSARILPLVLAM
jgi:hypothetical protein